MKKTFERLNAGKFAKKAIDKSYLGFISGGETVASWQDSPNGNPDKTVYSCTGNLYDTAEYDYNGRLIKTTSTTRPDGVHTYA